MRFAGNVIWFIFGGALAGLFWLVGAAVFAVSIIGLPLTRSAIEMAKLSAWPFGRDVVHVRELDGRGLDAGTAATGTIGFIFNLLWACTFGLGLCLSYVLLGIAWCITIIGIPFGLQAFKLAGISLWPIGRRVVTNELAQRAREHAAEERFTEYRSRGQGRRREATQNREPALAADEPIVLPRKPAAGERPALIAAELPPQLKTDRGWFVEVTGEEHRQPELEHALAASRPYQTHKLVVVALRPDGNRQDPDAVRVDHRGETLGYLPRTAARQYREALGTKPGAVTASIVGGDGSIDEEGQPTLLGIWLNAAWPPSFRQ